MTGKLRLDRTWKRCYSWAEDLRHGDVDLRLGLMRPITFVFLCLLAVAGCGADGSSPSAPTAVAPQPQPQPLSLEGTWTGRIEDSFAGQGSARVTLAHSGSTVSGIWASMFSDPTFNNGGRLSGTFSGSSLTLVLDPSDPDSCSLNVTATVSPNGNQITGSYASFECSVAVTGSLNLMKQS